jgi:hypothetical protein
VKVLGVNCSSDCAYFVLAKDGEIVDGAVELVEAPMLSDSGQQLVEVLGELHRVLEELQPEQVVLLKPEQSHLAKRTHSAFVPRIALETLVRLTAEQAGRPLDLLSRPTLRSRLQLSQKGNLATHVPRVVPKKVGKNWSEERQLAALAALAGGDA